MTLKDADKNSSIIVKSKLITEYYYCNNSICSRCKYTMDIDLSVDNSLSAVCCFINSNDFALVVSDSFKLSSSFDGVVNICINIVTK